MVNQFLFYYWVESRDMSYNYKKQLWTIMQTQNDNFFILVADMPLKAFRGT